MENNKLKLDELNRVGVSAFKQQQKFDIVLILDNIRSLNNVGTFFRTADAFNVKKIYLCGITGCPPHREIHKTALGATESVDWEYYEDAIALIHELNAQQTHVVAVEQTSASESLQKLNWNGATPLAFVLGNEVDGVQQEIIDLAAQTLEIPQFGTKHSLNVSVATGIVLWECVRNIKS